MAALGGLGALKLIVSLLVLGAGVTAISDDDFARVVIAQQFALSPSLDPSGTSWLPLPFWVYGAPMMLFGRSLEVARAVAVLLGVLSVGLVWSSARLLGAGQRGALLGAAVAAVFPYSAWLGVATVPELPAAGLTLFAVASCVRSARLRQTSAPGARRDAELYAALAALAITAASASRYEAWPVALGISALMLWDRRATLAGAAPGARARALAPALLGCVFPFAWLAHGSFRHGDALFFVRRVSEYKRALGALEAPLLETLSAYPVAFVRAEPELLLGALVLASIAGLRAAWRRPVLLVLLQLLTLVAGDLRGGGPTHHPERALLVGWLLAAVVAGDAAARIDWRARLTRPLASSLAALALAAALFGAHHWVRLPDLHTGAFVQRQDELDIGRQARGALAPDERLLVATTDYGYFAVMAAFGAPETARPLARHDPREGATTTPSLEALRSRAATSGIRWAVVPRSWRPPAEVGRETGGNAQFALLRLHERPEENSPRSAELD